MTVPSLTSHEEQREHPTFHDDAKRTQTSARFNFEGIRHARSSAALSCYPKPKASVKFITGFLAG